MLFHTMGFTGKNPLASWRMGETECCIAAMCALTKNVPTIRLPLSHTKQQGHMKPSDKISTQLPPRVADGFMGRVDEVEKLLQAIANTQRVKILTTLKTGERSVGALAEELNMSDSVTSQHLKKLKDARLVSSRRNGKERYYLVTENRKSQAVFYALDAIVEGISI